MRLISITILLFILGSPGNSLSQPLENNADNGFNYDFSTNFENSFDTDMDDGGEFSFYRFGIKGSVGKDITNNSNLSLDLEYAFNSFNFSGDTGFAGLDPWEDINNVSLGMMLRHSLNSKWTLVASPSISFSGESGSEFSDGLKYSGLAGFTYQVNRNLLVGTGVIATTRIEDDFIAFPGAILNWRINEKTILSTIITDIRTEIGPRVSLNYFINRDFYTILNAGYDFRRFRLDDEGIAPDGVGDIKLLPVWLTLGYRLTDTAKLEFYTGTSFFGEMELEDNSGDRIDKEDFDSLFFIGGGIKLEL